MRKGASLVELIVAFVVLGLTLTGVLSAMAYAAALAGRALADERAVVIAETVLDSLLQLETVSPGAGESGPYAYEWSTVPAGPATSIELTVHVAHAGPPREIRFGAIHAPLPPRAPRR